MHLKWLLHRQDPGLQPLAVSCNLQRATGASGQHQSAISQWLNEINYTQSVCDKLAKIANLLSSVANLLLSTCKEIHINYLHPDCSQNLTDLKQQFLQKTGMQLVPGGNFTAKWQRRILSQQHRLAQIDHRALTNCIYKLDVSYLQTFANLRAKVWVQVGLTGCLPSEHPSNRLVIESGQPEVPRRLQQVHSDLISYFTIIFLYHHII